MYFTEQEKCYINLINSRKYIGLEEYILEKYHNKPLLDQNKFEYDGKKYDNANTRVIEVMEDEKEFIFSELIEFYCFCEYLYSERLIGKIKVEKTNEVFFGQRAIYDIYSKIDLNKFLVAHTSEFYFPLVDQYDGIEKTRDQVRNSCELLN